MRAFQNRVMSRIFGQRRNEVTGGWSKLYNEEHHNLYCSPSTIRTIKEDQIGRAWSTNECEEECI
jgi:hypothetical protein